MTPEQPTPRIVPATTASTPSPPSPLGATLLRDPIPFDPNQNVARWLGTSLSGIEPSPMHRAWAEMVVPVHGTTVGRAASAISDGRLVSLDALSTLHPEVAGDRLVNRTDVLDRSLGLDRYVFLSVGRSHPIETHEAYFCFPNRLAARESSLVALREIVHFGGLVSPEAVDFERRRRGLSEFDPTEQNRSAAIAFFENLFPGKAFVEDIFPCFLHRHFPKLLAFAAQVEYPGTTLRFDRAGNDAIAKNAWEGPQLMVPEQIKLADFEPYVIVTTGKKLDIDRIARAGHPRSRIIDGAVAFREYRSKFPIGPTFDGVDRSAYLNLMIRDLAFVAALNPNGQSYPECMYGLKQFARG